MIDVLLFDIKPHRGDFNTSMQLFSLIIWFAKFTDPIRDLTDIRHPDCEFRAQGGLDGYIFKLPAILILNLASNIIMKIRETAFITFERKLSPQIQSSLFLETPLGGIWFASFSN